MSRGKGLMYTGLLSGVMFKNVYGVTELRMYIGLMSGVVFNGYDVNEWGMFNVYGVNEWGLMSGVMFNG